MMDSQSPAKSLAASRVVELRRYSLRPGAFEDLLRLFEERLVAGQEEAGMRIGGIFADEDEPDSFVWWRGFADMKKRRQALDAFYNGPVWREYRDRANSTMLDSDDVILLRHTDPPHGGGADRGPGEGGRDAIATAILRHSGSLELEYWFSTKFHLALEETLGVSVATWRSEPAQNTFPRLPVRPEPALVGTATFPSRFDREVALTRLGEALPQLLESAPRSPTPGIEMMRLRPTRLSKHLAPTIPLTGRARSVVTASKASLLRAEQ
jgi:hypothetical protein